jgi:hypothetical protein
MPSHSSFFRRWRAPKVAILLAVALAGVGAAVAAPAVFSAAFGAEGPEPIKTTPPDNRALGLVYAGLTAAKKGSPCVGAYEVTQHDQCSHGPDEPPKGLDVHQWIPPAPQTASVPAYTSDATGRIAPSEADITADNGGISTQQGLAILPDAGGAISLAMGPTGVVCDGDGVSGKRVQVLYVRDAGTTSRFSQYFQSFRQWAAGVDVIYNASAQETGGSRHVRFVTTPDCQVDVQEVEVPQGTMNSFNTMISALKDLGYNRTDRKYMIYGESQVYCGIGTFAGDDQPGVQNRNNSGPSYGRADSGCWTSAVSAHELGHNLGAVNDSAPHSSHAGHCVDEYDVMCYNDASGLTTHTVCANKAEDQRLDCGHDDYYNTNPSPGTYLATHWNVADNQFLINANGITEPTTPVTATGAPDQPATISQPAPTTIAQPGLEPPAPPSPAAPPAPTASPSLTPPAKPSPAAPRSEAPAPVKFTASEVTATSVRLEWTPLAGANYTIVLNGQKLGDVQSPRVQLTGMNPDTDYHLGVATTVGGRLTPYTETITVHTQPSADPEADNWVTITNSLSGGVVDLFGARSEAGTPLVMYRHHDGSNQLWKFVPAADGTFTIQSKATGLCVGLKDGQDVAGTALVSQACDAAPLWRLTDGAHGQQLTSAAGLVAGIGADRYFTARMLTLQQPTGARYQSWSTHPA